MKSLKNTIVTITEIDKKDATTYATIKRKDGGKFFGSHITLEVSLDKGLKEGEIRSRS